MMFDNFLNVCKDVTKTARKIPQGEYLTDGIYKIFDQGKPYVGGYCNTADGVATDYPYIIFGDHTRVIKYIEEPCYIGADGVKLLKVYNDDFIPKYVYYAMLANPVEHQGYSRHFKLLKETRIRKNEKSMQIAIIKELDKINQAISLKESEINHLDNLVKSRFIEMFGDPRTNSKKLPELTLPELGEFGRGVSKHRPRNAPELLGGQYPLIQTGEVANAELYINKFTNTYSELGFRQSKMWKAGTLCITIAANIAKTAILSFDACFPDSVVGFHANEKTNNIFIHFWFTFFQEILEAQAPASAQKNINLRILSELKVIVPPIELQNEFAEFVKQTDKSKFIVQKQIEDLQELLDSKMDEYFG